MKLTLPNGQTLDAEQVQFTIKGENFSEYTLSDGNTIKVHVILTEVYRLEQADPLTGKPNYLIKSAQVVTVA
jgi:hypothetical protein